MSKDKSVNSIPLNENQSSTHKYPITFKLHQAIYVSAITFLHFIHPITRNSLQPYTEYKFTINLVKVTTTDQPHLGLCMIRGQNAVYAN